MKIIPPPSPITCFTMKANTFLVPDDPVTEETVGVLNGVEMTVKEFHKKYD